MPARELLVVVSVLVIAWTGVLIRDVRVGKSASSRAFSPGLTAAGFDRQLERLAGAEFLNPDRHWSLQRLVYLQGRNQRARAIRDARRFLRAEPDNLTVWVVLLRASEGIAPRETAAALTAIRRLNPLSLKPSG